MKRVAFIFEHNEGWLGGLNYFRNLISAIDDLPHRKIQAVIFVGSNLTELQLAELPKTEIVQSRLIDSHSFLWHIRRLLRHLLSRDILLERLLGKYNVDVLSHSGFLGRNATIPSIGWIPDFQHFHLPEFYRGNEVNNRITQNRKMCMHCDCILLSSYDAQKDLYKFFPECAGKSRVLEFVADVSFDANLNNSVDLQNKYEFKGRYFLVPNQFWAHKNHKVIIEALHILRKSGRELLVLATGNTHDHRQPQYFQSILELAKELNVEDSFKVLGIVPRPDLMGLMHDAVAFINPSLFEGWSSSVEEAKSLGKRIILSDIPVHHEQNPIGGKFFSATNADELANLMYEVYSDSDPDRDHEMMINAHEKLPQRRQNFAKAYQDIVIGLATANVDRDE